MKTNGSFIGFAAIKKAVPITRVLDRYGLLKRLRQQGNNLHGNCPIHQGNNPHQFRVSLSKNCWICFGDCRGGGSIIDFVSRKEGVGIREAAFMIQDWFSLTKNSFKDQPRSEFHTAAEHETHSQSQEDMKFNPPLSFTLKNLNQEHPYLLERGLSKEVVKTFGIGHCSKGLMNGYIAIPIQDAIGRVIAYAGRYPGEPKGEEPRYKLPRGFKKSLELFNLHRAIKQSPETPLIVVEGFFDCMHLWQAGYRRTVAIMGNGLSHAQAMLLIDAVGSKGKIILFFDQDEAGRRGCEIAQKQLNGHVKTQVISLEKEGTQPDQLSAQELNHYLKA